MTTYEIRDNEIVNDVGDVILSVGGDGWIRRVDGEKIGRGDVSAALVLAQNEKHDASALAARQGELRGSGIR